MNKEIGKEIRLLRKYNHLTLRELEEKTGIQRSRLGKFERGEESPTNEIIAQIEKVMNVNFSEIFNKSEEIDAIFEDFLNSLFYCEDNKQLFKTKVKNKEFNYSYKFGKILLIEYVLFVLEGQLDEARNLEDELFEYFKKDKEYQVILYQYKGVSYRLDKDDGKAIVWFNKALSIAVNDKTKAMICYYLCVPYTRMHKLFESMKCLEYAKMKFSEYGSFKRVMYCLQEYALALKLEGNYDMSMDYFNRVLIASETIDCPESYIAMTYRNMCWTMILAKNYDKALEYLDEAIMIEPSHPFVVLYGIWCNYKLERYETAKQLIENSNFMKMNDQYSDNFELLTLLIKCKDKKPTIQMLDMAIKIVKVLDGKEAFERIILYIDIVLDILNRRGNDIEKIKYLEMKINLLQNGSLTRV